MNDQMIFVNTQKKQIIDREKLKSATIQLKPARNIDNFTTDKQGYDSNN